MDGNDSLKRILCWGPAFKDDNGEFIPRESKEQQDDCNINGNNYISREKVNQWAKGTLEDMLPIGKDLDENAADAESNPCAKRWKNMIDELTMHMCAKYPLAVMNELLVTLGTNIGNGYDIGCKFGTTLANSPLGLHARNFLVQNYKQALKLINSLPALEKQMSNQSVMDFMIFDQWLAEENVYLKGLVREPQEETLQMEYYKKLSLNDAQAAWLVITPEMHGARDYMQSTEMKRHHTLKIFEKDLSIVQGLETKLGIMTR
ncbi:hypothetical protein C0992_005553 [Termitomyces sp. T32_za158]|nr:hypothetical protein C0992_005553 [Termitomyces sp. T32_za158]